MKIHCRVCNNLTSHEVLFEHKTNWVDEYVSGGGKWQVVRCLGCEDIAFVNSNWFSEDYDPQTGELEKTIYIYPLRGENTIIAKDFFTLSDTISTVYKETISCFNNRSWTLCAIGTRVILEGICKEQGVISGPVSDNKGGIRISKGLDGKISGLKEAGLLTKKHSDFLHELRFLGNEAAHELSKPSVSELKIAIEIIEHTIENIYELENKVKGLKFASRKRKRTI